MSRKHHIESDNTCLEDKSRYSYYHQILTQNIQMWVLWIKYRNQENKSESLLGQEIGEQ